MDDFVTDEMVETAARAEWNQYKPELDGGPWEDLTETQRAAWREGVQVALAAALPLATPTIKAEALREAEEDWRRGHTFSVMEDWLHARADRIEQIEALGLTEELGSRSHGPSPMDCGVTPGPDILGRHNHRRWVTSWEEVE